MSSNRFDLVKIEKFKKAGKERSRSWQVGKALEMSKGGYMLFVPEGVTISGRIVMMPENHQPEPGEFDLCETYSCAADELGL